MREIRFRGKRLDNDEWVYGSLVRGVEVDDPNNVTWWIFEDTTAHQMHLVKYQHPVDPSTVGEFTGLCDKNGVEIYEGDILRDPITGNIRQIFYHSPAFILRDADSNFYWTYRADEYERIGNIHDNPELLDEVVAEAREGKE